MIPYGRQLIDQRDIDNVIEVLKSDFLTTGPKVAEFETVVKKRVNAKFATAVNSATSALHIACMALGLDKGDVLWTSPISFVASANCGLYCGASVDFVDIDLQSANICPKALQEKFELAVLKRCLPKILVVVHFSGASCEMLKISELCNKYGVKIIEDASHAIGATYSKTQVGSCIYSDVTVFSFHPVKIVTSGEGGIATTNNPEIDERIKLLRSHGITRDPTKYENSPDGPWYYEQIELGFNYRITDLQAALGVSQMNSLDDFLDRRNKIAQYYNSELGGIVQTPTIQNENKSSFHLYVIRILEGQEKRNKVFDGLLKNGIGANLHYIPIYRQPYYRRMGFERTGFPNSEKYYSQALTLPLYPAMDEGQVESVIKNVREQI